MGIISSDAYKRLQKPQKKHKLNAKKTRDLDGVECPSWLHAEVANILIRHRNLGLTKGFEREVAVRLSEKCNHCGSGAIVYKVDFVEHWHTHSVWLEAKGAEVASYRKRKRLWKTVGPGTLEIYKGRYRNGTCTPYLAEVITPTKGEK